MAQPNVVAQPLLSYNNFNFVKDGGYQGTVSAVATTGDGYSFAAVFNQNDNTIPGPDGLLFWPGCATPGMPPTPLPASSSGNCALQAAYNHTSVQQWNVNFSPQYAGFYSGWMPALEFEFYLDLLKIFNFYPSRIEGRAVTSGGTTVFEYRGRFGQKTGSTAPTFLYGQACLPVLSAIKAAPASTPLVSLQRFTDSTGAYVYQAVWSARIPQLP